MKDIKFKIPRMSTHLFFVVGAWCFGLQAAISTLIFLANYENHTFFSGLYTVIGILFSVVVCYFFFQNAHDSRVSTSFSTGVGVLESNDESIKRFIVEMKEKKRTEVRQ